MKYIFKLHFKLVKTRTGKCWLSRLVIRYNYNCLKTLLLAWCDVANHLIFCE